MIKTQPLTCKLKDVSFQCMTKFTTNKKKKVIIPQKKKKKKKTQPLALRNLYANIECQNHISSLE